MMEPKVKYYLIDKDSPFTSFDIKTLQYRGPNKKEIFPTGKWKIVDKGYKELMLEFEDGTEIWQDVYEYVDKRFLWLFKYRSHSCTGFNIQKNKYWYSSCEINFEIEYPIQECSHEE